VVIGVAAKAILKSEGVADFSGFRKLCVNKSPFHQTISSYLFISYSHCDVILENKNHTFLVWTERSCYIMKNIREPPKHPFIPNPKAKFFERSFNAHEIQF